jgi:hypothetical protein
MWARRLTILILFAVGCHKSRTSGGEGPPSAEAGGAEASLVSSPIAAARAPSGPILMAGIVASRGAVVAVRAADRETKGWTVDAITGVGVTANVELRTFPSGDGIALVYRGRREGRSVTEAVTVSAQGKVSAPLPDVSTAACATDDALVWISRAEGGTSRVSSVPWSLSPVAALLTLPSERDPMLICGNKTVYVLGDGERDTTAALLGGGAPRTSVVMRERDFGDEEREHDPFAVDDSLGLVRIGQSGSVSIREVGAGSAGSWRRLATKLTEADDVVAVDGDAQSSLVIFTRDDGAGCDGPAAPSVHALYVPKAGEAERVVDLAPAECDKELGQVWTGAIGGSFVAGWGEHASAPRPGEPKVTGLTYRTLGSAGAEGPHHVRLAADEIVDAGCDKDRCYAALLAKGVDGSSHLEVLVYP